MHGLVRDVKLSARALFRTPGTTLLAVLTLGVGIGANVAIFSVVNAVLLRELPFPEPDRLVSLSHRSLETGEESVVSPGNFYDWSEGSETIGPMAAFRWIGQTLTEQGPARRIRGLEVAGDLFGTLAVGAAEGRTLVPADDAPGAEPVVVLSHGLARELFGDRSPVGLDLRLEGRRAGIVGVMPPGFRFPVAGASFWLPARYGGDLRASRVEQRFTAIGRLEPGVSVEAADAELVRLMAGIRETHPEGNEDVGASVASLEEDWLGPTRPVLAILLAAVALVLLIACLNIANLLLARVSRQRREVAVRKAMGAGRWQIARRVGMDGVVLAALGSALGLGLSAVLVDTLVALFPLDLPRADEVSVDLPVLGFAILATLVAGALSALVPALQAAAEAPALRLRDRSGGGFGPGGALIIGEVLLAVVLLSGAALLGRSFLALRTVDPGFDAGSTLVADIAVPASYDLDRRVAFFRDLEASLEAVAGVENASHAVSLPLQGGWSAAWLNLLDRTAPDGEPPLVPYQVMGPDFTEVLGVELVRGRLPAREVSRSGPAEVLIDEALATRFWPDADPIGRQVTIGPDGGWIPPSTIVGVVAPVKQLTLTEDPPGILYVPHALTPWWAAMTVVVRTAGPDPLAIVPALRDRVAALDPDIPVRDPGTLQARVADSIAADRSLAALFGLLAALALGLALVGLFGLLSYTVARRTRELGIRSALGAAPSSVRLMVVGQGLRLVTIGLAAGIATALAAGGLLRPFLFDIQPHDPVALAFVVASILTASVLAAWIPASRATRVDPATALRAD